MQTFLPFMSFPDSAAVLDRARLGKQRVEAKQIILALEDPSYGWQNHPATKMWRGHKLALASYGLAICSEWRDRGYVDSLWDFFWQRCHGQLHTPPAWLGDSEFHLSHQSNLLRKNPEWYGPHFPFVPNNLPYKWPTP